MNCHAVSSHGWWAADDGSEPAESASSQLGYWTASIIRHPRVLLTVGMVIANSLIRNNSERQAKTTSAYTAAVVAGELGQSYQQRVHVLEAISVRPDLTQGLQSGNTLLVTQLPQNALRNDQFCRLVLRSSGRLSVDVSGPRPCWSPPVSVNRITGVRSLHTGTVTSARFPVLERSMVVPGQPAATLQAAFDVGALSPTIRPDGGARVSVVSGMTIVSSTDGALVGKTVAAPASRAIIRVGNPAESSNYAPLVHANVVDAYHPVPGTGLGVFSSMTTTVAYASGNRLTDYLFYGYLALLLLGSVLAGLVVLMLRRRDRDEEQSAKALHESQERLRQAFELAPIGKALIGLDAHYLQVNEAFCVLTGRSSAELSHLALADLSHPDDLQDALAGMDQLLAGDLETYSLDVRYLTASGTTLRTSNLISLIRDEQGSPLYYVAHIQDISEETARDGVGPRAPTPA